MHTYVGCVPNAFEPGPYVRRELRESGELKIRETPFNTAIIVQEVIEGVQQVLQPAMAASYEAEAADVMQQANAATTVQNQQTALMEQMLHMMQIMQQQLQQNNSGTTTTSNNSRNCVRTKIDKYCWMHGACAHSSADCRNKKKKRHYIIENFVCLVKYWMETSERLLNKFGVIFLVDWRFFCS